MNFDSYLKVNAQTVNQELDKILSKLPPLAKGFVDACAGGKRIRGVLVNLGYELGGGKETEEIFKVGAALEIMHTAILVHDDIMDKSPTRRGKLSLYKKVGVDQAIALGDLGFFLAIKIISETSFPEKEKTEALKLFCQVMMDTAIGQIMDLKKYDPITVARLKTAQYTICGPLKMGATLAGGKLDQLDKFGSSLGIAFQIRDDILDGEALDQSLTQALKYTDQAKKVIPKITSDPGLRQLLMGMTDYMIERNR